MYHKLTSYHHSQRRKKNVLKYDVLYDTFLNTCNVNIFEPNFKRKSPQKDFTIILIVKNKKLKKE